MKSLVKICLAGAAAIIAAGAGLAQQPPRFGPGGPDGAAFGQLGGPAGMRGRVGMRGGRGGGLQLLRAADENGDRSVTRAELDALGAEMFAWRDHNGDGVLDEADASPLARRLAALAEEQRADDAAERNGPRGNDRADANEDGRVTEAEFLQAQARGFVEMDADADGVLTPDEIDGHIENRRERGRWWRAP